ncbi:hypothetical protein Goklo_021280, partial [Gossypium klotzschianum]|nr:hypothetical protein [Gossypium klotzschianum]
HARIVRSCTPSTAWGKYIRRSAFLHHISSQVGRKWVGYPLSTQIANALMRPLRKSLQRLVARSYNIRRIWYPRQKFNEICNMGYQLHRSTSRLHEIVV